MLLSKRQEMFLPNFWPAYFSKAKGCKVWDLDGNVYLDFSLMGVGTNLLGYGHPEVDRAVHSAIDQGTMSTLNSPEEVDLADRLLQLNPWARMVKLARTGGEANAIAIRIARAATRKNGIAFCGYHGWHDWYLSANIESSDALSGHLLPGLSAAGVPEGLKGTAFGFRYNEPDELEALLNEQSIGVIVMEVSRNEVPRDGFLEKVRMLADHFGAALIFDESTSGFRETEAGLHQKYAVEPDMAIFGKTLGNGYAITAVVGRENIMTRAQDTFISSTFWTERIGPVAALKTLEVMQREQSWVRVTQLGRSIKSGWEMISHESKVPIQVFGLDALASFRFLDNENHNLYKTFLSQEMLDQGFLATTSFYASLSHGENETSLYLEAFAEVFDKISEFGPQKVKALLRGPEAHSGFSRLN